MSKGDSKCSMKIFRGFHVWPRFVFGIRDDPELALEVKKIEGSLSTLKKTVEGRLSSLEKAVESMKKDEVDKGFLSVS